MKFQSGLTAAAFSVDTGRVVILHCASDVEAQPKLYVHQHYQILCKGDEVATEYHIWQLVPGNVCFVNRIGKLLDNVIAEMNGKGLIFCPCCLLKSRLEKDNFTLMDVARGCDQKAKILLTEPINVEKDVEPLCSYVAQLILWLEILLMDTFWGSEGGIEMSIAAQSSGNSASEDTTAEGNIEEIPDSPMPIIFAKFRTKRPVEKIVNLINQQCLCVNLIPDLKLEDTDPISTVRRAVLASINTPCVSRWLEAYQRWSTVYDAFLKGIVGPIRVSSARQAHDEGNHAGDMQALAGSAKSQLPSIRLIVTETPEEPADEEEEDMKLATTEKELAEKNTVIQEPVVERLEKLDIDDTKEVCDKSYQKSVRDASNISEGSLFPAAIGSSDTDHQLYRKRKQGLRQLILPGRSMPTEAKEVKDSKSIESSSIEQPVIKALAKPGKENEWRRKRPASASHSRSPAAQCIRVSPRPSPNNPFSLPLVLKSPIEDGNEFTVFWYPAVKSPRMSGSNASSPKEITSRTRTFAESSNNPENYSEGSSEITGEAMVRTEVHPEQPTLHFMASSANAPQTGNPAKEYIAEKHVQSRDAAHCFSYSSSSGEQLAMKARLTPSIAKDLSGCPAGTNSRQSSKWLRDQPKPGGNLRFRSSVPEYGRQEPAVGSVARAQSAVMNRKPSGAILAEQNTSQTSSDLCSLCMECHAIPQLRTETVEEMLPGMKSNGEPSSRVLSLLQSQRALLKQYIAGTINFTISWWPDAEAIDADIVKDVGIAIERATGWICVDSTAVTACTLQIFVYVNTGAAVLGLLMPVDDVSCKPVQKY
jgi:hypothetical protein